MDQKTLWQGTSTDLYIPDQKLIISHTDGLQLRPFEVKCLYLDAAVCQLKLFLWHVVAYSWLYPNRDNTESKLPH